MLMSTQARMRQKLEQVFERRQAEVLAEVVETAYADVVKTSDFNELKGIVRDLSLRVGDLAQAQQRTEQRVEELAQAQQRTEQELRTLTGVVRGIQNIQASMCGDQLEGRYCRHAAAYLGALLRKITAAPPSEWAEELEARLPFPAFQEVLRADLLVRGQSRQRPDLEVWLVFEVSAVVDQGDVARAAQRAGYLRQAGLSAIAVAAGESVTAGGQQQAAHDHAVVLLDGQVAGWDEALAQL